MNLIALQQVDKIRQDGFRPQVVGCIISPDKKILFVYEEKYKLWQLPQGGIDNNETINQATKREMTEELGENFTKSFRIGKVIGEDKLTFPKQNQGSRKLQTDKGKEKFMLGKKYFFIPITTSNKNLDIVKTEFDDYQWLSYKESLTLTEKIYQKGKQKTTFKALKTLHKQKLL